MTDMQNLGTVAALLCQGSTYYVISDDVMPALKTYPL